MPPFVDIKKPTPGVASVTLAAGDAASARNDDRLIGVVVAREDRDAADIDSRARPEVGERNISRAAGIRRQEVGRLPDPAAGAGHIDGVAGGVRRIDGDRTHLARGTGDRRRTDGRPLFARQPVGLTQREDIEATR